MNVGLVDKNIWAAIVGGDETETLLNTEPLAYTRMAGKCTGAVKADGFARGGEGSGKARKHVGVALRGVT